jgi:hypothetical protein
LVLLVDLVIAAYMAMTFVEDWYRLVCRASITEEMKASAWYVLALKARTATYVARPGEAEKKEAVMTRDKSSHAMQG